MQFVIMVVLLSGMGLFGLSHQCVAGQATQIAIRFRLDG